MKAEWIRCLLPDDKTRVHYVNRQRCVRGDTESRSVKFNEATFRDRFQAKFLQNCTGTRASCSGHCSSSPDCCQWSTDPNNRDRNVILREKCLHEFQPNERPRIDEIFDVTKIEKWIPAVCVHKCTLMPWIYRAMCSEIKLIYSL